MLEVSESLLVPGLGPGLTVSYVGAGGAGDHLSILPLL